jgi:uncharacterized membrane protein YfcA
MPDFSLWQYIAIGTVFIWTGFVRSGLGFGGAALALPFMLLIYPKPLFFLPIIGLHLLFFATLTTGRRLGNVNWRFLKNALAVMIVPKMVGILGLLNLPGEWLSLLVFIITFIYALTYVFDYSIQSQRRWVDAILLMLGGYISGTSLIGAPLIVAVTMRYVAPTQLRDTLFALWIILVCIKLIALMIAGVELNMAFSLWLLPLAGIGHYFGLKAHETLIGRGAVEFRRILGVLMIGVTTLGLWQSLEKLFSA